ncbi:hypothetical protein AB4Z54_44215, partial [Streptomyces sp. MCAF7]
MRRITAAALSAVVLGAVGVLGAQPSAFADPRTDTLFTRCADADERDAFLATLAEVTAGARHWLRIILAVRSDAVDRCLDHPDLAAALRDGARIPVGPPSRHELREMIVQPAARAGVTVEPDLVACVLTEAAQQPGALPWAAHVLRETWQA